MKVSAKKEARFNGQSEPEPTAKPHHPDSAEANL
jgi:hypothetical protein